MNILLRTFFILTLCISFKYIPVFEPKGINYILSLFSLVFIWIEFRKLWNSLKLSESKKNKIQKIAYFTLIILLLISLIITIHKENPAGNIRFIRGFFILISIGTGAKIVGIISKSSINSYIKNSLLITYSTISFIAIIEIIFMFISLSHGSGEAFSGKIWGNRFWNPINKLGFRDEEPKKGKNTVFFVGDSFTAGWGVKNIEDRFGEIAAKKLKEQGKTINEINLGRYGADTKLEYYIFKSFIKKTNIKPKQVILQYFVNDMDKLLINKKKCVELLPSNSMWKKPFIEGSYLLNYLVNLYPNSDQNNKNIECTYGYRLKQAYNNDSIWNYEELELNKFRDYCKINNIKMTILFFPFMEDLKLAKDLGIENRIRKYCVRNNLKLLDVTKIIRNLSKNYRQASKTDAHASSKVHYKVGEKLTTYINL
jgi:lysophospholipase L1-like esterase